MSGNWPNGTRAESGRNNEVTVLTEKEKDASLCNGSEVVSNKREVKSPVRRVPGYFTSCSRRSSASEASNILISSTIRGKQSSAIRQQDGVEGKEI